MARIDESLLRAYIAEEVRRSLGGSHPNEAYDHDMIEDPAFQQGSVYVPDNIKDVIKKWLVSMGLTRKRTARSP